MTNKTKMKKLIVTAILLLTVPAAMFAADAAAPVTPAAEAAAAPQASASGKTLTFDECYDLAAQNNRDFRMAKLDKVVAEAGLQKAIASFGPSMSLAGGYTPVNKPTTLQVGTQVFSMTSNYYSARLSVSQPIFTFGKTFLGFEMAQEG